MNKPKRDYTQEILAKKARLPALPGRWQKVTDRLLQLDAIRDHIDALDPKQAPFKSELAKYIPIGYVACIEAMFRLVYGDLIDRSADFRKNVAKLKQELPLSLDHVVAMHSGTFTLGDFVGHLLRVNSLDDIDATMSTLIGESFLERLKQTKFPAGDGHQITIESANYETFVFANVKRLFELCHIFAHELSSGPATAVGDLVTYASGASLFLGITGVLVNELAGA